MSALVVLLAIGCGIPKDPEGTFERVHNGTMHVGVADSPPWVMVSTTDSTIEPTGIEADIIRDYARSISAEVRWHRGSPDLQLQLLAERKLDVVIGGLTNSSPWSRHVTMSTSYATTYSPKLKKQEKHVLALPPGENRWIGSIERFILLHRDSLNARAARQTAS